MKPGLALALACFLSPLQASAAETRPKEAQVDLVEACEVDRDAASCLKQAIRLYEGK